MSYPMIINCLFFALNVYLYLGFNLYCYRRKLEVQKDLREFNEQFKIDSQKNEEHAKFIMENRLKEIRENPIKVEE